MATTELEHALSLSPFRTCSLPPERQEPLLRAFLEMATLAIETEDDGEEASAYRQLKATYLELAGNPPIDPDRNLPAGLWEAMRWAAIMYVARTRTG